MAEINANIVVQTVDVTVQTTDTNINVTPSDIKLNVFNGGYVQPGGNIGEMQYNNGGILAGTANITYTNGNMLISNNNFKITGGNNGYFLQTDGTGNLTWSLPTGGGNGVVGGSNGQIQFNNAGNFAGIVGFTANVISNNISMPNNLSVVGNVNASYFIGNGALLSGIDTSKIQNGNSNISVAANSNITFGVAGNANVLTVANTGISLNNGNISNVNAITAAGNVTANYFLGNGALLTGIELQPFRISNGSSNVFVYNNGDIKFTVTGNPNIVTVGLANVTSNIPIIATNFLGEGGNLSNITAANITGQVANALVAGTVYIANQPNITSVGTLSSLSISGNITAGNYFGDGSGLINLSAASITGQVANALVAATVYENIQPNITSVGTLIDLTIAGNTIANIINANVINGNTINGNVNKLNYGIEQVNLIANQSGTYNFDILNGAINYSSANATANVILNFRGNSSTTLNSIIANGSSLTSTYLLTNGANAFGVTNIQIDGSNTSVNWINGLLPYNWANSLASPTTNSIVSYTFTIIKTSTTPTYKILGSASRYI